MESLGQPEEGEEERHHRAGEQPEPFHACAPGRNGTLRLVELIDPRFEPLDAGLDPRNLLFALASLFLLEVVDPLPQVFDAVAEVGESVEDADRRLGRDGRAVEGGQASRVRSSGAFLSEGPDDSKPGVDGLLTW